MEFPIRQHRVTNLDKYSEKDLDIAYKFAKQIQKELGGFIKGMVLFGSVARSIAKRGSPSDITIKDHKEKKGDIDVLLIVDDVGMQLNKELVQTYRVIVEKIIREVSEDLHVITLKFTSFWEYVRSGDPVAVNVLRDGVPIIDTGFFEPLQVLLMQGRIRPTPESVHSYFNKAPASMQNAQWHVMQALIDLYWAVIDSAHAALMKLSVVPPSPEHVADMIDEKLVKPGILTPKHSKTMRTFYNLMKGITRGNVKEIKGAQYDKYVKDAQDFVKEMENFINQ